MLDIQPNEDMGDGFGKEEATGVRMRGLIDLP
jgi:hypothetical protein